MKNHFEDYRKKFTPFLNITLPVELSPGFSFSVRVVLRYPCISPDPFHQSFKFFAALAYNQFQVILFISYSKLKGPLDLPLFPDVFFSDHGPSAEGLDDAEPDRRLRQHGHRLL